ncbi:MAG: monovalent cation/H(+) antiporter subunit G [Verrucomicrobiales bacterium]|nr:monovalent cation/H(+) antiporter subunit G [Verrucomicrobiales bacterium]
MNDFFSALLLCGAGFFAFVAGVGLVRFRDLPCRMHAATKTAGAAFALVLASMILRVPDWGTLLKAFVALGFAFLTLPVAAHLLGRGGAGDNQADASGEDS